MNAFSSVAYAGPLDFPRPDSDDPITTTTTMEMTITP